MKTQPTVSVVIPCYNGAKYLRETLESALNQTHPPLEVIVVDDGSTDDSAAIAESFGPPVRLIRQENQGESVARNRGIAEARGSHILFLDADDLLHSEALERLSAAIDGIENAVALMGTRYFTDDPAVPYRVRIPESSEFFPAIVRGNIGSVHCWLTPRALLRQIGGFRNTMRYFEDWDLWCQVGLSGARLMPVPFAGAYYRRYPSSQSHSARAADRCRGHAAIMERLIGDVLPRNELLGLCSDDLFWCGWAAMHRARRAGVAWRELRGLAQRLNDLVRSGRGSFQSGRFVKVARLLGIRNAERLRRFFGRASERKDDAYHEEARLASLLKEMA
jgi:GT2 family glycosyltransferase